MAKKRKGNKNHERIMLSFRDREGKIKTFEEALQSTSKSMPLVEGLPKDVIAYMKLRIIAEALNKAEKVSIGAGMFYPCFHTKHHSSEVDLPDVDEGVVLMRETIDNITPMKQGYNEFSLKCVFYPFYLSVLTPKLALYFAEQFLDIWSDYLGYAGVSIQNISIATIKKTE